MKWSFVSTVALAVLAAWALSPLLKVHHDVPQHPHQLSPNHFANKQGLWLHFDEALPSSQPQGVMFYAHGLGDHCGRYHEFSTLWNNHSFAFFCLDHQGHGRSEGERAYVETFDHYVDDYLQFIDLMLHRHPQFKKVPHFIAGFSMGGAISILVANTRPKSFSGALLLAPAIVPDPRSAAPWQIEAAKLLSDYIPKIKVGALDNPDIFATKTLFDSFQADPLTHKGFLTARWGAEMLRAMDTIMSEAATKTAYPFFVAYGNEDVATNMVGGEWLVKNAKQSTDKQSKVYPGWKHGLLQEPEREQLYNDIVEWVRARI